MDAIQELHRQICRQIAAAYAVLMQDVKKIRERQKDWTFADLEKRARWARYTLEVYDLEKQRVVLEREMVISESHQPIVTMDGN